MPTYRPPVLPASHITPREAYLNRRALLAAAGLAGLSGLAPGAAGAAALATVKSRYTVPDKPTALKDVTSYNNFYEFGTDKGDPARHAAAFQPLPWTVTVGGLVAKPATFDIDQLVKRWPIEERIYRMRCVEGWSMVIPWNGFALASLLDLVQPLGSAKYVAFETVERPAQMPGQRGLFQALPWPYVEGLRLDEAMHPLTLLAVGLYGQTLPAQNGAPIRLVVPWKYGFKGIKSIVRITLTETQPATTWNRSAPGEYGFYANVNPQVDHPRWSQASERRIGAGSLFAPSRQPTLPFNGYAQEVARLYAGMDLRRHY